VLALARLPERVNRADVRVIECGGSAGLLLEAEDAGAIPRQVRRQELERNLAPEAQLGGEPHFAHASGTEQGEDLVWTELRTRPQGHVFADIRAG
jgi:hypothetical protein